MEQHTRSSGAGELQSALDWLEQHGTQAARDEMAPKYGIHTDLAFGVSMANMKVLAKRLGRSHDLAVALWETGWYALLWSLSRHDRSSGDEPFLNGLLLVEDAAGDERIYVKKAVNMAKRRVTRFEPRRRWWLRWCVTLISVPVVPAGGSR